MQYTNHLAIHLGKRKQALIGASEEDQEESQEVAASLAAAKDVRACVYIAAVGIEFFCVCECVWRDGEMKGRNCYRTHW